MADIWSDPKPPTKLDRHVDHHRIASDQEFDTIYSLGNVLGQGSFGVVKQATLIKEGRMFAVKTISKDKTSNATEKLIEREVNIMKRVNHAHIICLEEVYETSKQIFLIMELCTQGSLEKLLKTTKSFSEVATLSIIRQLIGAVAYLHDNDIVHRDLKLENILLSDPVEDSNDLNIKITDFGLSYICDGVGSDFMMQQMCGTPTYMAPEVIINYGYSKQCDIWSVGVIMFILLTGDPPFIAPSEDKLFDVIKKGIFDETSEKWSSISDAGQQLIKGMLEIDPAHRYTSKEVLRNHPWIQGKATANGIASNVLQMMVEYDKEQKKEAELSKSEEICFSERQNCSKDDATTSDCTPAKSSRTKSPSKSIQQARSSPNDARSCVTSFQASPQASKSEQNNNSPRPPSLPSYMQPTKSSMASKNTAFREGK